MNKNTILRNGLMLIMMLMTLSGFSETNRQEGMKVVTEMGCSFSCPEELEQMMSIDGESNKEEGSGFLTVGGKLSLTDALLYEVKTGGGFTKKDAQAFINAEKSKKGTKMVKQQVTNDGFYYETVVNDPQLAPKPVHYAVRMLVKGKKSLMLMLSWINEPLISKNKDAIIRSMKVQ